MRGLLFGFLLLAAACGGKQSVASKSAAAYDEAKAKGTALGGGHDHGGHEAGAASETASAADAHAGHDMTGGNTAMDHSAHRSGGSAVDHSAMGHGTRETPEHPRHGTAGAADAHAGHDMTSGSTAMDHSAHRSGGSAVEHSAMGHGTRETTEHARHGTASAAGVAHDQHAGTQHAVRGVAADPHAQHRQAVSAAAAMDHSQHGALTPAAADPHAHHRAPAAPDSTTAPRSNAEIRSIQPPATLRPDAFDVPAPASVSEASKAQGGAAAMDHSQHGHTPAQPAAATIYTCPMHPEVTSDEPATCPKCAMALVKKN